MGSLELDKEIAIVLYGVFNLLLIRRRSFQEAKTTKKDDRKSYK
jgi:hypothetical protein